MNLERTHDMGLVETIMRDRAVWPSVHDDRTHPAGTHTPTVP
jgi:hypothetical protein